MTWSIVERPLCASWACFKWGTLYSIPESVCSLIDQLYTLRNFALESGVNWSRVQAAAWAREATVAAVGRLISSMCDAGMLLSSVRKWWAGMSRKERWSAAAPRVVSWAHDSAHSSLLRPYLVAGASDGIRTYSPGHSPSRTISLPFDMV